MTPKRKARLLYLIRTSRNELAAARKQRQRGNTTRADLHLSTAQMLLWQYQECKETDKTKTLD
jgi:hypothetical protein